MSVLGFCFMFIVFISLILSDLSYDSLHPYVFLPSVCVMFWLVALVMFIVSHWLVCVMWPLLFGIYSPHVANRLVGLHAALQRSAAAWQKQCILVRTFVWLWSALQPPYDHMCHQSTARAKRDQPPRSGAAVAQNQLREPWWRHTLFSLVRFCDDKHDCCMCLF